MPRLDRDNPNVVQLDQGDLSPDASFLQSPDYSNSLLCFPVGQSLSNLFHLVLRPGRDDDAAVVLQRNKDQWEQEFCLVQRALPFCGMRRTC